MHRCFFSCSSSNHVGHVRDFTVIHVCSVCGAAAVRVYVTFVFLVCMTGECRWPGAPLLCVSRACLGLARPAAPTRYTQNWEPVGDHVDSRVNPVVREGCWVRPVDFVAVVECEVLMQDICSRKYCRFGSFCWLVCPRRGKEISFITATQDVLFGEHASANI